MNKQFFLTVDAETGVIAEGIKVISEIRDEVERQLEMKIPIVWFIRFQREWTEYIQNNSVEYFKKPLLNGFNGFEMTQSQLPSLIKRGDEIGWHYHAYNYVERDDLDHSTKLEILKTDLVSCMYSIKKRYKTFNIKTFRFGWFFVPDYDIYNTLRYIGIEVDASIDPNCRGKLNTYNVTYLKPITSSIKRIHDVYFFPFMNTELIHDWNVVPHHFESSTLNEIDAIRARHRFKETLLQRASELKKINGAFCTYQMFLQKQNQTDLSWKNRIPKFMKRSNSK